MADLGPSIDTSAQSPQTVTADGLTAGAHPLDKQIQADRYSKARSAQKQKLRGVMFTKLIASGPVSDVQGTNQAGGSGGTGFDGIGF